MDRSASAVGVAPALAASPFRYVAGDLASLLRSSGLYAPESSTASRTDFFQSLFLDEERLKMLSTAFRQFVA
jgi:hypothetical protein